METDIDVYKIHRRLKKGYQESVICKGCEMIAVSKEQEGVLMVGYPDR